MSLENLTAQTLIVGAGVLGSAIADEMAGRGHDVVLVEAQTPGHAASASGDTTRILRSGYGSSETYTRWAWEAHTSWRQFGERVGETVVKPTGVLWLASGDGAFEEQTYQELSRQDIPVRRLTPEEIAELYPSINIDDVSFGVLEPDAGVLRARRCVELLAASATDRGAQVLRGVARPADNGVEVDGRPVTAQNVVWATGAWLPALFPEVIDCTVTAQDAVFVHADGQEWAVDNIPAWIDPANKRYGIGAEDGRLKIASSALGPEFDPWQSRPATDQATITTALEYAAHRFPALASTEPAHIHPCQYSSTADTQFILARHPKQQNWWFAGGDSGHAFKHALRVAQHVSDLVDGAAEDPAFGLGPRDAARGLRVSSNQ